MLNIAERSELAPQIVLAALLREVADPEVLARNELASVARTTAELHAWRATRHAATSATSATQRHHVGVEVGVGAGVGVFGLSHKHTQSVRNSKR